MPASPFIQVVVAPPGEMARIQKIVDSVAIFQELLGGYMEIAAQYPADGDKGIALLCNEDGLRLELPLNRVLETGQHLVGTLVAVKFDPSTGDNVSMTDGEAERVAMQLNDSMIPHYSVASSA